MDILFATTGLEKQLTTERKLMRTYGPDAAKVLRRRLDQLKAAEDLAVLRALPGRCHELREDRNGQLALDLRGPYRLIFEPAHDPLPTNEGGGLDWKRVTAVRILEVEDYHG